MERNRGRMGRWVATALAVVSPVVWGPVRSVASEPAMSEMNPLFEDWTTPFGVPPFEELRPEHFRPAFERAMAGHKAEIAAIVANPLAPTFANTLVALDRSGEALTRVGAVFSNLNASHTNDELQAVEREMAPRLAKHRSDIALDEGLFRRVDALYRQRDRLVSGPEERRLLERYHLGFVRAGAQLGPEQKTRLAAITERLAELYTTFSQNVLAEEKGFQLVLEGEAELAGLPEFVRTAAAQAGQDRGLGEGKHVITLSRSSIEPFLTFSDRRDLRERAFAAWIRRGDNGNAQDNKGVVEEIVRLRIEQANLLGYRTFADYKLADTMAGTPAAVERLLKQVWEPARARAGQEVIRLRAMAESLGHRIEIEPWDWRYYAEKVRQAEHALDEAEIKPYFQLDRMIEAMFHVATRLFGVTFEGLPDLPRYHPDVRAFEVKDRDGGLVGVFYSDNFARPSKRSGAWMSSFRSQQRLDGPVLPVVVNNNNFSRGAAGQPTLLSFDDGRTLFHEFGHGLHGLLSDVTYPYLAGTRVLRDFVELPSQIYEHWFEQPEVLRRFAVHFRTEEPIPAALLDRLIAARNFNQGFATVEYTAAALVDLAFHTLETAEGLDVARFEAEVLEEIGMPREIVLRHRPTHFAHLFSSDGYAAGYYSYLWAEVLDADGFEAFEEAGDPFDAELARRLHQHIYASGGTLEPMEAYVKFRGREPRVEALLRKRGL